MGAGDANPLARSVILFISLVSRLNNAPHVGAARRVLTLRALGARMRSILSCSIVYTVVPRATQNPAVVRAVGGPNGQLGGNFVV
jgi:hypothetical protein